MVGLITVRELFNKVKNKDNIFILDVRSPSQHDSWHFFGSFNLSLDQLIDNIGVLPRDKEIITICNRGDSSRKAAQILIQLGFNAKTLDGGLKAWNGIYEVVEIKPIRPLEYKIFQVQRLGKGCLSYIIVDEERKSAIIVDPTRHTYIYSNFLKNHGLSLGAVLDTHIHSDHISGASALSLTYHVDYLLPQLANVSFPFVAIQEALPRLLPRSQVLIESTPGHTRESSCINIDNIVVFSGDTLFLESVGRPDLGDNTEENGRLLYESITNKLFLLDDNVFILPAHNQQAMVPNTSMQAATLRYVKRANRFAKTKSVETFVKMLTKSKIKPPAHFKQIKSTNGNGENPEGDLDELEFGSNLCAATTHT